MREGECEDSDLEKQPNRPKVNATVSKATAIVLVLALGFHSLFEGIAFGLQTEISSAGQLAAGVIIHKTAAAISLGGTFASTGFSFCQILLFIGLFSILTPIGVVIGMLAAETNLLVDTIFVCLSGGTFIYVACSEIIITEFDRGSHRWAKMLLVILGGLVIASLWFLGGAHNHGSEEDGHEGHDHLLI